uniref:AAA ATPase domain-containing protein n=1 Tax=Candidatus Kentrum sp. FM TaxID=2126340 RepID=A0A450WF01_9GAMM|nr:MAG: AAA ATPase domain-containing protein [Candidatus Kentron sp. FM]VFJ65406.1 MAG: AAA ATPase domain-containing protein [Candidatus Kentron sp. FM]VFK15679.1 MAG: AAA ATPase domain-containing protein [Candidatus Kentron sp. FM]
MQFVFVDNYRGFSNTLIPIKSVNFLVGENSTGKTSILALLKLLSPLTLWFQSDFDARDVGLGAFKDIVSVGAPDSSYFSVGIVFDEPKAIEAENKNDGNAGEPKTVGTSPAAHVMTFTEGEGMPRLSSIVSYRDGLEIRIKYVGNSVRYKYRNELHDCSAEQFADTHLRNWVNLQKSDRGGYTILKNDRHFINVNVPPISLFNYLRNVIIEKKSKSGVGLSGIPSFPGDIIWLAPIRSKPRKTYDEYNIAFSPEGDHTPYLIKKNLASSSKSNGFKGFLDEVGEKSGLFKKIEIKNYGRGTSAPFELDVVLSKEPLDVSSVGYGVSQALPVIVEMFTRPKHSWFAIQQPEVHLHPKAQAALGEIFFKLASTENKRFIVETHSDYTIDRYRISCRRSERSVDAQVLFFERGESGNKVTPIPIDDGGNFSGEQPAGYRAFFIKEEMELLGL